MWSYDDTAFCDARRSGDTNRCHFVTMGFTGFQLTAPSNCCARKNFSRTHQISGGYLFSYNQTNCLRIHRCSERSSQVLDRGRLYNVQSA
jgi:hypothetical protein